jgi:hypothetical protein
MVDLAIIVSVLLLYLKIGIGASDDYKDCAMSWESFILLLALLDLWRRSWLWVGFGFYLWVGVILCWIGDLRNYWRICFLRSRRGVFYLWS